ncbi:CusA/CzcA family heavy metal efflux RND transporter [Leeuwenhoekiella palythoae]|uniref:Cobalt-zinc-cadmium resistance protein CzcA n=1 Tax=Leeuwenhoekiella palythoae TaxID=573501 RepID=A0A1M5ZC61_9FLAO|nr:CusA/CzcA family heavy metal efflux RND transporter [Leeuwenhoekiella palythoae]SHI21762.1 cobalt-zinc-cadmium resistance protein CzcA [Leeuwenhoekiella palythoae]
MINRIIDFSITNKLIIGLFTLLIAGWGIYSLNQIPIDAVPDITNNQVQVITTSQNLAAQEVEQFITYPVELAMANIPGVVEIRSISRFGLSVVTVVFEENMGTYLPRQLVNEKLKEAEENIGADLGTPSIGPISTGLGEIYQYTLEVEPGYESQYDAVKLRSIQDWIVKRQLSMTPGVVEISSWGGYIKQYEVAIDPSVLNSYDLTLPEVFNALQQNNANTGGSYIEKGPELFYIRSKGLAKDFEDIRQTVITNRNDVPLTVGQIGEVGVGKAPRYGAATKDGKGETVVGIVMMLKDANSADVIARVKDNVARIQQTLPEGITIKPFLDRTRLVEKTTSTISENLIIGGLIVIFFLVFLLGTWRSGLIVASVIPLSMLFALGMMNTFGVSANLMSLGAIDFGIIVDGAVIIIEAMVVLLVARLAKLKKLSKEERKSEVNKLAFKSSSQMMNAAIFGQIIILIVFIPILTLSGIEGKMFRPMALVFGFAIIGAMILCLTYVPMIASSLLYSKKLDKETWGDKFMGWLERRYRPVLDWALSAKNLVVIGAVVLLGISIFIFSTLGGEFIPKLDEGDFALETRMAPGTSLEEMTKNMGKLEAILLDKFPEVKTVVTKIGAGEIPTDPMPIEGADIMVSLKNKDEWTSTDSKEELAEQMEEALSVLPGVDVEFSQPIEMRFNELMTGVKQDIAVKIYGEDLELLQEKGNQAGEIIRGISGAADVRVEQVVGLPQIVIDFKRNRMAEYGLTISELNQIVSTAFAGATTGKVFEGERRFDLTVRLQEKSREGIASIQNLYVPLANGQKIPLREVADITFEDAPAQISRDDTSRRIVIGVNVRNRDTQSLVEEMQNTLQQRLDLPPGYSVTYGGEFENLQRAQKRLSLVVPLALVLIFVILFISLRSLKQSLLIYTAIPFAAVGGVFALWLRGMPFSISAGVGFIALFGVAVLNGLVLISSLNELKADGVTDLKTRIRKAAKSRLRPIFLTAVTDIVGFLPMALSGSSGAEVQRPLATVVIGGLFTATLLTLIVLPVLYSWFEKPKKIELNPSIATVLILLLVSFSTHAQTGKESKGVSLEQLKQRAIANNPMLKADSLNISKNRKLQATAFNPSNTSFFYSEEEVPGNGVNQSNLGSGINSYGISQNFDFPTTYIQRSQLLKQRTVVSEKSYQLQRNELERQVATAYYKWVNGYQKVQFYNRLDSLYTNFEKAAKLRYETGETTKLEQLNASSNRKQIELRLKESKVRYNSAVLELEQLTASKISAEVYPSEIKHTPLLIEDGNDLLTEGNAFLSYRNELVNLAEEETDVQQSQWLPDINLQYSLQTIDGTSGFYGFQAGISIPLIFNSQKGNVQALKIERMRQEELFKNEKLTLSKRLATATANYEQWLQQVAYYEETGLPMSEELFDGASLSFRVGGIDYIEYIQSLSEATNIKINWFDALLNYNLSVVEVEYLTTKK